MYALCVSTCHFTDDLHVIKLHAAEYKIDGPKSREKENAKRWRRRDQKEAAVSRTEAMKREKANQVRDLSRWTRRVTAEATHRTTEPVRSRKRTRMIREPPRWAGSSPERTEDGERNDLWAKAGEQKSSTSMKASVMAGERARAITRAAANKQ